MKLLFDQNISFRIIRKIDAFFPGSDHIRYLGLENATDLEIYEYAKENEFTVVTFDADFLDIVNYKGFPPKLIWLRTGNQTTDNILEILKGNHKNIKDFIIDKIYQGVGCLELKET